MDPDTLEGGDKGRMSRDLSLDELPGGEKRQDEPYEPGMNYEPQQELVRDMVYSYLSKKHWASADWKEQYDKHFDIKLRTLENLDGQMFLDGLVSRLQADARDNQIVNSGIIFEYVIPLLYLKGNSSLTLDLSQLPVTPSSILDGVRATESNPLSFTIKKGKASNVYDCLWLGEGLKHCIVEFDGVSRYAGGKCENSTFYFDDHVGKIGEDAINCEFYLRNVRKYALNSDVECLGESPLGKILAFHRNPPGTSRLSKLDGNFFRRGNRLFISKDGDDWTELFEPKLDVVPP